MTATTPKPMTEWPPANRAFFHDFRDWLQEGGYGESSLKFYSIAARLALGILDKPYREIDSEDVERVWRYVTWTTASEGTRSNYRKGLAKLAEYLHHCRGEHIPQPPINWDYYVGSLPGWLADDVRAYVAHRRRTWLPEKRHRATINTLSHLTKSLRWMARAATLADIDDLTPDLWFDYLDERPESGIKPTTLNCYLWEIQIFLQFLVDAGRPVRPRMLRVQPLPKGDRLPRDVPVDQLLLLLAEIEAEAASPSPHTRRMATMDKAWFSMMVYSGLRVGEIRRLKQAELDLKERKVRIEQSKGLKDRIVPLANPAVEALAAYLDVRGPAPTDHLFIYRHGPLSTTYCNRRLKTYGRRCGVTVTPHQLRHSAATMLLNAGAPLLTVKEVLGHERLETTLVYTRLYEPTVASHYYLAMAQIEGRMGLREADQVPSPGLMLALVDSLHAGTLNEAQREATQALRAGILALAEQVGNMEL